jgi:dephospho-CoA kinase
MRVVGLTGGIASGKSTVARMLVELGARLVDADLIARQVVEPGRPAWTEIVAHFGVGVLGPDRTLNRDRLGEIVFRDEPARQLLNGITHPRIGAEMVELIQGYQREGAKVVIIDAALLLESLATSWVRPVVVVTADEAAKVQRIMARDGLSREQALARIKAQWSDEERKARADFVIDNSGTLEELRRQVAKVWQELGRKTMPEEKRKGDRRTGSRRQSERRKANRGSPDRRTADRRKGERRQKPLKREA